MACATMMKPAAQDRSSDWSSTFPAQQSTLEQSTLFMKKLLAVAVSEIMYLRAIFPQKAFGHRRVEDLDLRILSEKSSVQGACQVIQWMRGCFNALEKKYLREIQLAIYLDENKRDEAIESYIFRFAYHDNETSVSCNNEPVASTSSTGTEQTMFLRKATLQLLRTTIRLTQSLDPLPEPAYLGMKLLYFDDVTPADYEPEGFKPCATPSYSFANEPINIKVGDVNTRFHQMRVRVKTDKSQFDDATPPDNNSAPATVSSTSCDLNNNDIPLTTTSAAAASTSTAPTNDTAVESELATSTSDMQCEPPPDETSRTQSPAPNSDCSDASFHSTGGVVICPCGDLEDDGLMIQCMSCGYWQHGVCFAILKNSDAPREHFCHACSDVKKTKRLPTDSFLQSLSEKAKKDYCLWRRTLQTCLEVKTLTPNQLCTKLNISPGQSNSFLERLEKEGFITTGQGRIKSRKTVKKDIIISVGIPRYLTRNKPSPLSSATSQSLRPHSPTSYISAASHEIEVQNLVKETKGLRVSKKQPPAKANKTTAKRKQGSPLIMSMNDSQEASVTKMKSKRLKSSSVLQDLMV